MDAREGLDVVASVMNRNNVLYKAMAGRPSVTISDELMYQWIGEDNWLINRIHYLEAQLDLANGAVDQALGGEG